MEMTEYPSSDDIREIGINPDTYMVFLESGLATNRVHFNKKALLARIDLSHLIRCVKWIRSAFCLGLKPAKEIIEVLRVDSPGFLFEKAILEVVDNTRQTGELGVGEMFSVLDKLTKMLNVRYNYYLPKESSKPAPWPVRYLENTEGEEQIPF